MLKPILGVILLAANALGCGKDVKQGLPSGNCTATELPAVPAAAGLYTFSLPDSIDPCSVYGYVVGHETVLRVARASDGSYYVNNLPAGQVDIVINASSNSLESWLSSPVEPTHGVRLKKVKSLNGVKTDGGKVDLPKMGSLAGKVVLSGQVDHAGIDVYIPGTEYIAKTDSEGRFAFSRVPVGEHNLYLEKDGYHRAQFEDVEVREGAESLLDDATLVLSTGAEGFILTENGAAISDSRTVSLTIGATDDAVLMKISESNVFEGAAWRAIRSSTQYTFDSQGDKTLFVKFANANGLESSPYRAAIKIEIFPTENLSFSIDPPVLRAPNLPSYALKTIAVPKNASEMIFSVRSDFLGSQWQSVAVNATITLPQTLQSCTGFNIYLKFKDKDGFESQVIYKNAEFMCSYQVLTNSPSPTLRNSSSVTTFDNRVFVFGGWNTPAPSDLNRIFPAVTAGEIFDPAQDTWLSISQAPERRCFHSAVWTGQVIVVWGGGTQADSNSYWPKSLSSNILTYSPSSNQWTNLSTGIDAPSPRFQHSAVWTGTKMIVWGGRDSDDLNTSGTCIGTGHSYDLNSGTWAQLPTTNSPSPRCGHIAAWTGTEMIISGGYAVSGNNLNPTVTLLSDGAAYNPKTETWRTIANAPAPRGANGAVGANQSPIATANNNLIYVVGGSEYRNNITSPSSSRVTVYDIAADLWSVGPVAPGLSGNNDSATWFERAIILWSSQWQSSTNLKISYPYPFSAQ